MELNKNELLTTLKMVLPGVDSNSVLFEGMDVFVFDDDVIKSYNNNISVSFPFNIGIKAVIKAFEFYSALSRISGDIIHINCTETQLTVSDDVTMLSMNIVDSAKILSCIESMQLNDIEWDYLPETFVRGVELCSFSIASNTSFGVLNFLRVEGDKIVTSDNFRASVFTLPIDMESFSIMRQAALEIVKIVGLNKYAVGEVWVHFKNESGVVFSVRKVVGDYPSDDILNLFEGTKSSIYKFPIGLKATIDRIAVFSYQETDMLLDYITLEKRKINSTWKLVVKGQRVSGSIEDRLPLLSEKSFPDGIIRVAPKFLKSILAITDEFCIIQDRVVLFRIPNYLHIVILILLEK